MAGRKLPVFQECGPVDPARTAGFTSFANAEKPPAKMAGMDTLQRCVHRSCSGWKGGAALTHRLQVRCYKKSYKSISGS